LQVQSALQRVGGAGECDDEAVAFALLDGAYAAVGGDGFGHGLIEPSDGVRHDVGLCFP
jgi:hypothetical protein